MCDPLTLGGIALAGIGGLVQGQQQQRLVKAQNNVNTQAYMRSKAAREAERARQKTMEQEATTSWEQTLAGLTPQEREAAQAEAEKGFMESFDSGKNDTLAGQFLAGQQDAAPEIKTNIAEKTADAAKQTRERVAALASLSGGGSVDVARGQKLNDASSWLQTLNGLRRGSLGVSQFEQNIQPATVTPRFNPLGSILTGIGSTMAGMGPMGGASPMAGTFAPGMMPHVQRLGF